VSIDPAPPAAEAADAPRPTDFIRQIVREDLATAAIGRSRPASRPSPTASCTSATPRHLDRLRHRRRIRRLCNLRLDDTNPVKEDPVYVEAIKDDVRWLGFDWHDLRHASTTSRCCTWPARKLIAQGDAFVCDLTAEQVREYRGSLTEPGRNSPYRDRSVEENLDLFRRMRAGEFPDGARTLRAKIDMAAGNINLRDPGALPHQARRTPPDRQRLADLPDVRLRALAERRGRRHHAIRCARWSSKTTARCTTGAWTRSTSPPPPELVKPLTDKGLPFEASKPRQIEFSRLNLNYT
jgi:glutaminyl-tRNA synthetase